MSDISINIEIINASRLYKNKKWEESINAWEKIIKKREVMFPLMYYVLGDSYFELKNYKKAKFNYLVYINLEMDDEFYKEDNDNPKPSFVARKISRCIYELEGLKATKYFLKEVFDVFKDPYIWGQLSVFMRESGYEKLADYYQSKEGELL